ncbi:MAG: CvpA family protein [Acidobacteria bacterium]|nr:CvpA family protein [Acidobacteriota bacterium]
MNWLDILLCVLLAVFVFEGVRQGFARIVVGMAATLLGLLLAAWFYGSAAALLTPYLSSVSLARLAGFLLIFIAIQLAGALLGWLLATIFKWTGLSWLDRGLGALFGAVKAALIGIVLVLIITAFPLKPVPASIATSQAAPYLIGASHILAYLCPRELREGFLTTYDKLRGIWAEIDSPKHRPTQSLPKDSA